MIFLETARLLFRAHRPGDEPAFIEMHTDPQVRRYGGPAWPKEKAIHRFRSQYLGKPTRTYGLWATILREKGKEDGKFIGSCGLHSAKSGAASIGFYIARPYWGRGLATEAAQAFIHLAFARLRLRRILADMEKGHAASERILQELGFTYVREEHVPGGTRIIRHYELPLTNWQKTLKDAGRRTRARRTELKRKSNGI